MRENGTSSVAIAIAIVIVALDQIVKWAVDRSLAPNAGHQERWLIDDWLGLSYVKNRGVAFGLLDGSSTLALAIAAVATIAAIGVFTWLHRSSGLVVIGGAMIAAGAVGNLVDRIRLGYVRDFFAVGPWPTFNVADSALTVGVAITILGMLQTDYDERRGSQRTSSSGQKILDPSK
jgi:signal peptidase II